MEKKIRLRYAPSPTGFLHIGNTRTALFNYLLAKHYQGAFILRIEDTDVERNVEGAIASQLDNLRWLGIEPDETIDKPGQYGPYTQLERLQTYAEYANKLLATKKAYYCFCTAAELEASREKQLAQGYASPRYVRRCYRLSEAEVNEKLKNNIPKSIRFFVPDQESYDFNDLVRGPVHFESKDLGDWVIMKSNGIPTYNFAVVIDDILMEISHVVRGEEHISNTPKQLMIYRAFEKEPPIFAHLTLIVNEQHKKLSKRDGHLMQFISQYREIGYLPNAIFNFIALLGWSPLGEEEIFTKEELIKIFDETRLSKSPSMFDVKKLTWMNNLYIKKMSDEEYLAFTKPFLASAYDLTNKANDWLTMLLLIYKKELQYGQEIVALTKPFFVPVTELSSETIGMLNNLNNYQELIVEFRNQVNQLTNWNEISIKEIISMLGKTLNVKGKDLFMPIRIFASHQEHGPELAKVIYLLGKEQVIKNIDNLLNSNEK
ncbi:glutamate--tRNA ligase [Spiroplasma eriocheiris]|uniref:Glutamate--tRNA ligase n=1 Tax=Spiroplasma eriocheiris TaxID=315358 RepID=A0A0H3XHL5_9MOLU|nr:glutamate--tRNA ligase [Spiroplasma eriocheiris]AHF57364.1 glutamyl-tRNA synthetase [Spiroplasma eriocheiris CCTCC M 207170]AKM53820.1 glutamyl-tRNA synthetase [Spiroplasma eriocheiris]